MQNEARAFWVTAPGRGEIRHEQLGTPGEGQVLVRALYSAISRGTESLVFNGRVPASERERMRAPFQAGEFPGPVKYGYCSVGRVEHGPPHLTGRNVFVLYPHQTRFIVPAEAVHLIPDDVRPERAVLAANVETAVNGLWDATPHVGDRIAVVGAGTVGCLIAWLAARVPGTRVELIDINPGREGVAAALGASYASPDTAERNADLVIHASGAPDGLALALELAGQEARVVEMSWFGDQTVPLALGGPFHARRLAIVSSQVGTIGPSQRSRWDHRRRMSLALSLLADPVPERLITGETPFERLPDVMASLASGSGHALCHRIVYE
jgi:threonine dehydrogenase-like Zn-dependent dehydrogenase